MELGAWSWWRCGCGEVQTLWGRERPRDGEEIWKEGVETRDGDRGTEGQRDRGRQRECGKNRPCGRLGCRWRTSVPPPLPCRPRCLPWPPGSPVDRMCPMDTLTAAQRPKKRGAMVMVRPRRQKQRIIGVQQSTLQLSPQRKERNMIQSRPFYNGRWLRSTSRNPSQTTGAAGGGQARRLPKSGRTRSPSAG